MGTSQSKFVTISDGIKLHYLEAGAGPTIVMVPGWSQAAESFKYQIDALSDRYHIIAIDMRGHGESDKPAYGYRIARLAADLHEALTALNLQDIVLLGHSMGCSILWSYWDLFGGKKISKLVLVDQMPMITRNAAWSEAELEASGAVMTAEDALGIVNALVGPTGNEVTDSFITGLLTKSVPEQTRRWLIECNFKMPRELAAALFQNHSVMDWRDVIPRINLPTLVVGGRVSTIPWRSQVWIHEKIPGSKLEIFEADEGGQHFMFVENPEKFNRILSDFVG